MYTLKIHIIKGEGGVNWETNAEINTLPYAKLDHGNVLYGCRELKSGLCGNREA